MTAVRDRDAPAPGLEAIRDALGGLIGAFATDGYVLRPVSFDGRRLRMAIDASEGACAECLVPHDMMAGLVRTKLPPGISNAVIEIEYPHKA